MQRKSGSLLIAVYVMVQALIGLHTAAYGVEKHQHDGKTCAVYLQAEHQHGAVAENLDHPVLHAPVLAVPYMRLVQPMLAAQYAPSSPRAPPFFS
jgi:hypothetical protein